MSLTPGMGLMQVGYNESEAARRRLYFHLVDASGDPVTTKNGQQPQISVNGDSFTSSGVGTLLAIGSGYYYAEVTQATTQTNFAVIFGRYDDGDTVECMSLNTLIIGDELQKRTQGDVGKMQTDRSTAQTKVYKGDGTTVWFTRERSAPDEDTVQIAPV